MWHLESKEPVANVFAYLKIKSKTSFVNQLQGRLYYEGKDLPWRVVEASQMTWGELFEAGAKVKATSKMAVRPFGPPASAPLPTWVPRWFVFDKPFYVFFWRDRADWPYGTVEILCDKKSPRFSALD